jgi:hypothetical protein
MGFAEGIRALMRQDPDIIMVGEIRDLETAEMAIQAALTGHLVLSTLHTNDAPSAMTRLLDLGVPPYLLSATVIGVMAQRLVRTLCPHCKKADERGRWTLRDTSDNQVVMAARARPWWCGRAGCAPGRAAARVSRRHQRERPGARGKTASGHVHGRCLRRRRRLARVMAERVRHGDERHGSDQQQGRQHGTRDDRGDEVLEIVVHGGRPGEQVVRRGVVPCLHHLRSRMNAA